MSYKPRWKRGQWKAICDVCGGLFHSGDLRQRWDGFMVCKNDFETRHPQDFLKGVKENPNVPWSRREPSDVFITPNYINVTPTPAPTSIPATDQSSWRNPFNSNYTGPAWTVPAVGSPPAPAPVNVAPSASWNSPTMYLGQTMDPVVTSDPNAGDTVTVALTSGALPTGITLNSSGTFNGTILAEGSYSFTLTPTDNHGLAGTPMSATVNVIRQFPSTERPTGLDITTNSSTGCTLVWVDNTAYETYYHLQRQNQGSSTWTDIGTVVDSPYGTFLPSGTTTYPDTFTLAEQGTIISYRVRAVRVGAGSRHEYSSWSDTLQVVAPVAAPAPAPAPAPITTEYVYEYYKTSALAGYNFRYGTSATAPAGYTTQGVAFLTPVSSTPSVTPVYEWSSTNTEGTKYIYDVVGTTSTSGWVQGSIAFYVYTTSVTASVAVFSEINATAQGAYAYYTVDTGTLPTGYSGNYSRYYAFAPNTPIGLPSASSPTPAPAPAPAPALTPGNWTYNSSLSGASAAAGTDQFLPIGTCPAGALVVVNMTWQGSLATATITNTSQTWNYTDVQINSNMFQRVAWTWNNAVVSSGYNPCFHLDSSQTQRACTVAIYTRTYTSVNPYVGVQYSSSASATSTSTAAQTPTAAMALSVSCIATASSSTVTAGTGFTVRSNSYQSTIEDKIQASTTAISASATLPADRVTQTTLLFQDADTAAAPAPAPAPAYSGVPVYEYYKTGTVVGLKFRYGTSPAAPTGYTTQGVAFYGANSGDTGAVAIHEWSAGPDSDGDTRYAYDTVDTGGWTDTGNTAFYAFSASATSRIGTYACLASTSEGAFTFYTITSSALPASYTAGSYLRYYVYDNGTSLAVPTAPSGGGTGSSAAASVSDNRIIAWHTPIYPWDSSINYTIHDGKVRADEYYHMAELPAIGGSGPYAMTASSSGLKLGTNGERLWRFDTEAAATAYLNSLNTATGGALGSSRATPSGSQGGVYYFRLQPPLHFTDGTTRADFNTWGNVMQSQSPYISCFSIEPLNGLFVGMAEGSACDVYDVHWSDNGAPYHQQPIEIQISKSGGNIYLNFRVTYNEPNLSAAIPSGWVRKGDEPNEVYTFLYQKQLLAGHRYYYALRFNFSNDSNGYYQIYERDQANGTTTKVLDYSGRLGDNFNPQGNRYTFHSKLGLYQWWTPSETIDYLSDGQLLFNDVAGSYSLTPDAVINALITG
jgi:hypothetical protein